jgi:hypothetical protein
VPLPEFSEHLDIVVTPVIGGRAESGHIGTTFGELRDRHLAHKKVVAGYRMHVAYGHDTGHWDGVIGS